MVLKFSQSERLFTFFFVQSILHSIVKKAGVLQNLLFEIPLLRQNSRSFPHIDQMFVIHQIITLGI